MSAIHPSKMAKRLLCLAAVALLTACAPPTPDMPTPQVQSTPTAQPGEAEDAADLPVTYSNHELYFWNSYYSVRQVIVHPHETFWVEYPQLSIPGTSAAAPACDWANEVIQNDILAFIDNDTQNFSAEAIANGGLSCNYLQAHSSERFVSFRYPVSYYFGGVYGIERLHAINLDLESQKQIFLDDILDLDGEVQEKFRQAVHGSIEAQFSAHITRGRLLEHDTDFYFDCESLTIVLGVDPYSGFYMQFRIPRTALEPYVKDAALWEALPT